MSQFVLALTTAAVLWTVTPAAWAQSFNIDIGDNGLDVPPPTYGAAGLPGVWNLVPMAHTTPSGAPQAHDYMLVDIDGNPTGVGVHQFGGMDLIFDPDPLVTGADGNLMSDGITTYNPSLDSCFYFNGLENGRYELLTYAWRTNSPGDINEVFVDFTPGLFFIGGPWTGQHEEGVTYARHIVDVTSGFMRPHAGLPAGGNTVAGGPTNGMQLRLLCADENDACAATVPVFTGDQVNIPFDTTCVETLGNGPAHGCGMIERDLWFRYTPPGNGTITVSTEQDCAFDSAIAVYQAGAPCPPSAANVDQCADTPGTCEALTIDVTATSSVLIRVGSVVGEYGEGDLSISFEASGCNTFDDCADLDTDGIRDDGCVWWACESGSCTGTDITYADLGGPNGSCTPDGTADANDRFHALNCFSNQDTLGLPGYACEANPPAARNVDAAGFEAPCSPDGVCDANDAFAALNAFEGTTPCSCAGPAPLFDPQVVGTAGLTLQARSTKIRRGGLIDVDVYIDGPISDLRGYQLHALVRGGQRGSLQLVDMVVPGHDQAVFAGLQPWAAFNLDSAQMAVGLDGPGVGSKRGGYLATLTFRASRDARGTFMIDLDERTFLFPTAPTDSIELQQIRPAIVILR